MQINIVSHQEYDFSNLASGVDVKLDIGGIIDTSSHRFAVLALKAHDAEYVGGSADGQAEVQLHSVWPDSGELSRRFRDSTSRGSVSLALTTSNVPGYVHNTAELVSLGPAVSIRLKATQAVTAGSVFKFTISVALILLD